MDRREFMQQGATKAFGLAIGFGSLAELFSSCKGDGPTDSGEIIPSKDPTKITLKLVAGANSFLPFTAIQNKNNPANDADGYGYYPNIIVNYGSFKIATSIEGVTAPVANTAVPNQNLRTHFQISYNMENVKENNLQDTLNVKDPSAPLAVITPVKGIKSLYSDDKWDVNKIEIYVSESGLSTLYPNTGEPTVEPQHTAKKALANAITNFASPPFPMQQALAFTGSPTDLPPQARIGANTLG